MRIVDSAQERRFDLGDMCDLDRGRDVAQGDEITEDVVFPGTTGLELLPAETLHRD